MNVAPVSARPSTAALRETVEKTLAKRRGIPAQRSMLVAVGGVDGSGKGYLANRIVAGSEQEGLKAIAINADARLHLPARGSSNERPEVRRPQFASSAIL